MSLPLQMDHPSYTTTLPVCKKKIKFRPFLEKERKILLMANEGQDAGEMADAILEIIHNCCLSDIDISVLSTADIEYFFLQLRAKSIGETVPLRFICNAVLKDSGNTCNNLMVSDADITTVDVTPTSVEDKIKLTSKMVVKMRYPSFMALNNYAGDAHESLYYLMASCVEYIADGDTILYAKDYPIDDMVEFVLNLQMDQFEKLEAYVADLPTIQKKIQVICSKCGYNHSITLEGYQSFFL